jgi:predicted DNA-binding protein with PD1-like motif
MPGGILMRFITEIDLRNDYRQTPFNTYKLATKDKLTSEARQFLQDRKITIITEEQVETTEIAGEIDVTSVEDEQLNLTAQLLYTDTLKLVLLAKEKCSDICEELYAISLVIKQMSSSKKQEITLKMPSETNVTWQDKVTLNQLFSQEGDLIVHLLNLEAKLNIFKEESKEVMTSEQKEQLEIISFKLRFLTAQLIGE